MDYPFWDVGIGYGILMACVAVIHVFVSHFAIGGGLYLVVAETFARKKNDTLKLQFLEKMSKFFILVTVVFGALTGVGIWFIIGLLNPAATEVLIHHFVWAWASEWAFFIIEIAAAILYFYGWKTLSPRNHLILGWIYFIAAWMSLFIINGILTFMLSPGEWITTGNFWDGFFNPTFWSSLWLRTGVCIMLAGVYSLFVASRCQPVEFKTRIVRYNSIWVMVGLAVTVPALSWYVNAIPKPIVEAAWAVNLTPVQVMHASYINASLLALLVIVFGFIIPRRYNIGVAVVAMFLALGWFSEYEWLRESIRKPFVITDYMYANGVELSKADVYAREGYLSQIKFRTGNDGADLYRRACQSCHTINGYKALKPAFDGTDEGFIAQIIMGTHVIRGNMPPFLGNEKEAGLIASHLYSKMDHRHLSEVYGLEGVELGKKVYDVRCGKCHVFGGFNDKAESLLGISESDIVDILDTAGELGDEMPDFTGDPKEQQALIEYLLSLKEGGNN